LKTKNDSHGSRNEPKSYNYMAASLTSKNQLTDPYKRPEEACLVIDLLHDVNMSCIGKINKNVMAGSVHFLACIALLATASLHGAQVEARVLAKSGDIKSQNSELVGGQTLKTGASIQSATKSGAIVSTVPGQIVFIDGNTDARILAAEITEDDGPKRSSSVFLGSGHLHATVEQAKQGSNTSEIRTPCGLLTSSDASWSVWSTQGGGGEVIQNAAVYYGTVTLSRSSKVVASSDAANSAPAEGGSVRLTAGQVATWRSDDPNQAITIVDLTTGRVITVVNGVEIGNELATPRQLLDARALFAQGIAPFGATSSDAARIAMGLVIADINRILIANMLTPLQGTAEWYLFPDWSNDRLKSPADFASPEKPAN
jgi:hypothetical protein